MSNPLASRRDDGDRRSPIHLFVDAVKGMTITPFVRVISAILACSYGFMAWDPLFSPNDPTYDRPLFDAVFAFASPIAWGIGFAFCAVALAFSAITARAATYVLAVSVATVTLLGWASMIIFQSWNHPDADLTSGAYGLYAGTLVGVVGLAFSPRQLAAEKPIVAVVDGEVVPMKRVG